MQNVYLNSDMRNRKSIIIVCLALAIVCPLSGYSQKRDTKQKASKPLYHDPVFDGAADPTVIWNRKEKKWFMFYTNRRATAPGQTGVTWVHGTRIGIAESSNGGAT